MATLINHHRIGHDLEVKKIEGNFDDLIRTQLMEHGDKPFRFEDLSDKETKAIKALIKWGVIGPGNCGCYCLLIGY